MKKKLLAFVLCLAMVLSLAACSGGPDAGKSGDAGDAGDAASEEAEPAADGGGSNSIVVAMEGEGIETLDPGYVYETYANPIMNACYENLFKFYGDGPAEPCLVDTYEFSDDALTLTCTLKDGIVFASGNPMTSADVAFSINRCKNLKGNPSFIADTIESIETPDDKTVVFHLTEPDSAITSKLTYSSLGIVDSVLAKEQGATDAEDADTTDTARNYLDGKSLGSGMFVLDHWTPNEEVVLTKNENYWGEATNVDQITIKLTGDANNQLMTLSKGDIDLALNLTDDTLEQLNGAENIGIVNDASKTVCFLLCNMDEKIGKEVSNPLVQQAIRKALDYAGIQQIVGEGTITPYSIIQDGFLGARGVRETTYQNIDEALELMKEAGYEDGFEIDFPVSDLTFTGVALTDVAQKVKDDLAKINITLNIQPKTWAGGYGDAYREGDLGFTVMYWSTDYNDPNVQLAFLPDEVVGLRAKWTADMDPEIAAMIKECMAATDDDARAEILGKIQDATYEHGPWIMLAQGPAHYGYNTRLTGVAFSDPYVCDFTMINVAD